MDVFISYRRKDQYFANLLYYALKSEGLTVFLDVKNKESGFFTNRLENAIMQADKFILIIGEESLIETDKTDWYRKEIDIALDCKDKKDIIPVLLPGMRWPINLRKWPLNWFKEKKYYELVNLESIEVRSDINNDTNFDSILNEIINKFIKPKVTKNSLTDILCKSVSNCKAQSIFEYIIQSRELQMQENSELHLLTDNYRNYDFSVIAKIAIARNVSNNSKYIYYSPHYCENDFDALKISICEYIRREKKANIELDRWIRKKFLFNNAFIQKLSSINNLYLSELDSILSDSNVANILDEFCVYDESGNDRLSIDSFISFLKGDIDYYDDIVGYFKAVRNISRILNSNNLLSNNGWGQVISYIEDVYFISDWVINMEEHEKSINKVELENDFKRKCRKYRIDNHVVEWLIKPACNELPADNILFCSIRESELPFSPCYSFSLFLASDGHTEAGAWYTASNDNDALIGNTVVVRNYSKEDLVTIKAVFRSLIASQNKEIQNAIGSRLMRID